MTQYKSYINGEWRASENEITISSPINNEILGTVPAMSQAEVDDAMASARAALPAWRALSAVERAAYLHKAADILERDQEKTGAMGYRMVAAADEQIDRLCEDSDFDAEFDADDESADVQPMEPDEIIEATRNAEAREILAAANRTMADQLKEETDKLLDSVLYTASMNMKNGFHMSDF